MKGFIFLLLFTASVLSIYAQPINQLTEKEKQDGWRLLFNGKDLSSWHAYNQDSIGPRWQINTNGILELHTGLLPGGDLVTNELIKGDFEFKVDWRIGPSSNSGVFFFVEEAPEIPHIYTTGLELQIQDNRVYQKETQDNKHLCGDFFGILKATNAAPNPLRQWNQYHVIFKHSILDVYLNGAHIHHILTKGPAWKSAISKSLINGVPFAKGKYTGHIGLQDWHSVVSYRNIKIRS